VKDYIARVHGELCVFVQLETRVALGNLEAIAAVDGVDGLFIGPSDLAADMGHLGNSPHPDVRAAIDEAIARIVKTGKVAGILAPVEADARHWMALGCLFVAVGSDAGILARQSEALAAKFKS
jgi:4-hydroxy-2-oxoheptanedioate aldolase